METVKTIFNHLDQAVIPEHDKSLIATGALLKLIENKSTHIEADVYVYIDCHVKVTVKGQPFKINYTAGIAAIESYELYLKNPDEYKNIYSPDTRK